MAKNNKYTSINFNHIYEKNTTTNSNTHLAKTLSPSSSSSFASYSAISAPNKSHGRMLVLTRPTPKPLQPPQQPQPSKQTQQLPDRPRSEPGPDAISLRPLGRTGTGSLSLSSSAFNHDKDKEVVPPAAQAGVISPKPDKFVPPHLRPGFVKKEEKPGPEFGRPKSGGYERMRRGGVSDMGIMNRPRSSGCRPSSSG